jgi:hypothetical protein
MVQLLGARGPSQLTKHSSTNHSVRHLVRNEFATLEAQKAVAPTPGADHGAVGVQYVFTEATRPCRRGETSEVA